MYTDRIDIFHITYGDAVSCGITHYFVLDLFPARDAALYQYFSDTAQTQSVGKDVDQFILIMRDSAAASAKCVGRTQYDRITDGVGELDTVFHIVYDQGSRYRLI